MCVCVFVCLHVCVSVCVYIFCMCSCRIFVSGCLYVILFSTERVCIIMCVCVRVCGDVCECGLGDRTAENK